MGGAGRGGGGLRKKGVLCDHGCMSWQRLLTRPLQRLGGQEAHPCGAVWCGPTLSAPPQNTAGFVVTPSKHPCKRTNFPLKVYLPVPGHPLSHNKHEDEGQAPKPIQVASQHQSNKSALSRHKEHAAKTTSSKPIPVTVTDLQSLSFQHMVNEHCVCIAEDNHLDR